MAHAPLATTADFESYGLPASAWAGLSNTVLLQILAGATGTVLGYVQKHYKLPIVAWGQDLRRATCLIAARDVMVRRGFNPASAADQAVELRHSQTLDWLRLVARGEVELVDVTDSSVNLQEMHPMVESDTPLDWGIASGDDDADLEDDGL